MLSPIVEEIAAEYEGKVEVVKIDIDDSQDLAQEYGVTSIPTVLFLREGQMVEKLVGFQSKDSLKEKLDAL